MTKCCDVRCLMVLAAPMIIVHSSMTLMDMILLWRGRGRYQYHIHHMQTNPTLLHIAQQGIAQRSPNTSPAVHEQGAEIVCCWVWVWRRMGHSTAQESYSSIRISVILYIESLQRGEGGHILLLISTLISAPIDY